MSPVVLLLVLAVLAVVVAVLADHLAWPMSPAFPWLHGAGKYAYVATKSQWELAAAARGIAWAAAVLAGLLLVAAVGAGVARRRRR